MRYRYRTDEEMKDSGVEWIGNIPKDWEIKRNRHIFDFRRREVNEYEDTTVLSLTISGVKVKEDLSFGKSTESYIGHQLVYPGDIVFTPRDFDQTPILSGVSKYYGCISNLYFVLKCKPNISNYFVDYFWWGLKYKVDFFKNFSYGIRYGYNYEQFKDLLFLNPSYIEQGKIANFLDEKTSQFDLIISKKEELIKKLEEAKKSLISEVVTGKVKVVKTDDGYELVKRKRDEMKDSGVEWLGNIPKDWEISKLKYLSHKIIDGAHFTPTYIDTGIPFLRVTDITNNKEIDLNSIKYIPIEEHNDLIKRCYPKKGDLLISKNGTIGVTKVVDWDWEFSIFVSLCLIKLKEMLSAELLSYYFKSNIMDEQISIGGKKTSITNLHLDKIREFIVPIPIICEQNKIIEYLNYKEEKLDKIINNTKIQIEKLKEAKQSLISEAVTGKIEILD